MTQGRLKCSLLTACKWQEKCELSHLQLRPLLPPSPMPDLLTLGRGAKPPGEDTGITSCPVGIPARLCPHAMHIRASSGPDARVRCGGSREGPSPGPARGPGPWVGAAATTPGPTKKPTSRGAHISVQCSPDQRRAKGSRVRDVGCSGGQVPSSCTPTPPPVGPHALSQHRRTRSGR